MILYFFLEILRPVGLSTARAVAVAIGPLDEEVLVDGSFAQMTHFHPALVLHLLACCRLHRVIELVQVGRDHHWQLDDLSKEAQLVPEEEVERFLLVLFGISNVSRDEIDHARVRDLGRRLSLVKKEGVLGGRQRASQDALLILQMDLLPLLPLPS